MEHYYSEKPSAEHHIRQIKYSIKDLDLSFITDTGVFLRLRWIMALMSCSTAFPSPG